MSDAIKPNEILLLESHIGFELDKVPEANIESEYGLSPNSYCVNKEGMIIGLSLMENTVNDLSFISPLKSLIYLNLTRNAIGDIGPLFPNDNLVYLFVGGNKIRDLRPLRFSTRLKELALWQNPVGDDLQILGEIITLEGLYIQDVGVKDISFIRKLHKLRKFYASENQIVSVPSLNNLKEIREIDLSSNLLTEVPVASGGGRLDVSSNSIKFVPIEVALNYNWHLQIGSEDENLQPELVLGDNPLKFPPMSVLELGEKTIDNYYEAASEFGHAPLSEGRIIVIGDGSAGKSSLIERILYSSFEQGKSQTNGIKIEKWSLKHIDNRELKFHIWDFGGQEIQHAVHKFFFTEGCLYVLVLDNRKEEEPEYWLQQISSLGGNASVLVVFNKQDDNPIEIADRKFLKEKYSNIVGFYNVSCKTGFGIIDFKNDLERWSISLATIDEQFPNNWFDIKTKLEERTTGSQHYLDYETYYEICRASSVVNEDIQRLLLRYFTTIGAITWFGDTYLNFLHVLSPAWITQGVYKIITSKRTANLFGQISISDFSELLTPVNDVDYVYEELHYGYILSMMKKFDLCYTPDDRHILIPSAFRKEPKIEYSDFRGEDVRTYILQFRDYMPLAVIHRFIAKKLPDVYDNVYWYSGIVIKDTRSESLAMVQADRDAKRIYVRVKGQSPLGIWEHIRRELNSIAASYASVNYNEFVALDDRADGTVDYQDLISHIQARKAVFFHPKLKRDFNVGYLMGLFESKEVSIEKLKGGGQILERDFARPEGILPIAINILNNNSPTITTQLNSNIVIDIDVNVTNKLSSDILGEVNYLLGEVGSSDEKISSALNKLVGFLNEAKAAKNSASIKEKGWSRKLGSVIKALAHGGEQIKNIEEGGSSLKSIFDGLKTLCQQFNMTDAIAILENFAKM